MRTAGNPRRRAIEQLSRARFLPSGISRHRRNAICDARCNRSGEARVSVPDKKVPAGYC